MHEINLSASSLNTINTCTFKFYCEKILKLPKHEHPKTKVGSLVHEILYYLRLDKHKYLYDEIIKHGLYHNKILARYIKYYCQKQDISFDLEADLNNLILVALKGINFYHKGAQKIFEPEHEFEIKINDYLIKGFIDSAAIYKDYILVYDYKTKGAKFAKDELTTELQAFVYQYYMWVTYKMPCVVEFVLLRHPPTKRTPDKHIQRVEPKTEEELKGFEIYLNHMGNTVRNFGYDDAINGFCKNVSFCNYVCEFRKPFSCQVILDKEGKILKKVKLGQEVKLTNGQTVKIEKYNGCPKFYGHGI